MYGGGVMNKFFTFRSSLAVLAVAGVVQGAASAACWYPDEIVADQVKDFQYMLMVGALQCRNGGSTGNEGYDAFVTRQRNVLDSKGYVLKGHFLRENGVVGGRAAYDQYSTALSNRHAGRMDEPSFCQTIAVYTRLAATASDHDFVTLAEAVIEAPVSSCATAHAAAAAPIASARPESLPLAGTEPLPPVARRAAPVPLEPAASDDPYGGEIVAEARPAVAAPPPPAAPEPVAVAVAEPVAAPPIAVPRIAAPAVAYVARAGAIPVTAIVAAPVVPPEEPRAAASPAAALQAAIIALQAAADALKAQSGPTS